MYEDTEQRYVIPAEKPVSVSGDAAVETGVVETTTGGSASEKQVTMYPFAEALSSQLTVAEYVVSVQAVVSARLTLPGGCKIVCVYVPNGSGHSKKPEKYLSLFRRLRLDSPEYRMHFEFLGLKTKASHSCCAVKASSARLGSTPAAYD